jgi:3-hydroxybutyryl-CoA dehydrogenase
VSARVAVLGAGTMGHGIAQVCAMAGDDVLLADATEDLARRAIDRIRSNLEEGVRRGKLDDAAAAAHLGRISTAATLERAWRMRTSSSRPCPSGPN